MNIRLREREREGEFPKCTQLGGEGVYQLAILFSFKLQDRKNSGKEREVLLNAGKTSAWHVGVQGWPGGCTVSTRGQASSTGLTLPLASGFNVAAGALAITSTPQAVE